MTKLNNKGFVMAETLVAAVFVMIMFTVLYTNFYPLVGEYEKREVYDDVDSKYGAFWIKRLIQYPSYVLTNNQKNDINTNGYTMFKCDYITNDDYRKGLCKKLLDELQVEKTGSTYHVYLTRYQLGDEAETGVFFKNTVRRDTEHNTFTGALNEYVSFLPNYNNAVSLNGANYRIVVEFRRKKDGNDFYSYSNIEVKK